MPSWIILTIVFLIGVMVGMVIIAGLLAYSFTSNWDIPEGYQPNGPGYQQEELNPPATFTNVIKNNNNKK